MNTLGGIVRGADENGLFLKRKEARESIYQELANADVAVEAGKFQDAQKALVSADGKFHDAWNTASPWWRLCYAYGFVHNVVSIVSGAGVALLLLEIAPLFSDIVPLHVCVFAVCGAVLRSLFYLSFQANRRALRAVWIARSFTGPIIAILLAVGMFLALKAGLVLVSDEGAKADPNIFAVGFLSMGAGLFWEEAMEKLRTAFSKVRSK